MAIARWKMFHYSVICRILLFIIFVCIFLSLSWIALINLTDNESSLHTKYFTEVNGKTMFMTRIREDDTGHKLHLLKRSGKTFQTDKGKTTNLCPRVSPFLGKNLTKPITFPVYRHSSVTA